jgi:Fe-S-cluster-containing dehydrogenase component
VSASILTHRSIRIFAAERKLHFYGSEKIFRLALSSAAGAAIAGLPGSARSNNIVQERGADAHASCLVDTTLCIGCRKCEEACNRNNKLPKPELPFSDKTVFRVERRPTDKALTVVNRYFGSPSSDQSLVQQTHVKVQCMHCLDPACVSACIVGALYKTEDGPVLYNADICLGCRYCMIACPFEIPAYEYYNALKPRVKKCEFCANVSEDGKAHPACAAACPVEAIVFGKRGDLMKLARRRIKGRPDRYIPRIYGDSEVGGTSWLYLNGRAQQEIGLLSLPDKSPPRTTEAIQHGIFEYGALPLVLYGALGALLWRNYRLERKEEEEKNAYRMPDPGGKK